jgi:GPH family glycoside/pentoside/hexuronide:cation symporter
MIIAIALIPITNALGGDQSAWIKVGAVFGVIVTGSLILTFFANKEQSSVLEYSDEEKLPFMQSLGYLLSNKYWVIMLVVMVLVNIIYAVAGASGIYYAKWVLKDENLIALLGGIGLIPVFIGFPLTGYMSKKFGQSGAIRVSLIIGIIGTIIRGIFPTNLPIMLTASVFSTFGTIPLMAIGGVLVNNTVEYGVWKYNKRIVGMTNSASSFGGKISGGLGAAMLGWVLGAMGYVGTAVAQPQSAITGILIVSIWIPLALMIGILVAMLFYDLDDKFPMIMKELEVRKAQNESH